MAEKFHAMVTLGLTNSRMRDYFDIAFLGEHFTFEAADLTRAIRATFVRRGTPIPVELPIGISER